MRHADPDRCLLRLAAPPRQKHIAETAATRRYREGIQMFPGRLFDNLTRKPRARLDRDRTVRVLPAPFKPL